LRLLELKAGSLQHHVAMEGPGALYSALELSGVLLVILQCITRRAALLPGAGREKDKGTARDANSYSSQRGMSGHETTRRCRFKSDPPGILCMLL
jgi:hypothetical protein